MVHECSKNPMPTEDAAFAKERERINAATHIWFPNAIEVAQGEDEKWYLKLNDEFAVPIEHCPFCGLRLA